MTILTNTWHILSMAAQILSDTVSYSWKFCRAIFYPRAKMAARLLATESQLALYRKRVQQKKDPRPRFTPSFRILWVLFSKMVGGWDDLAQLMQPATVKKWHTRSYHQRHLDLLLKEFIEDYYHSARPHQGLEGKTPIPSEKTFPISGPSKIVSTPVVGGLHHRYCRAAA